MFLKLSPVHDPGKRDLVEAAMHSTSWSGINLEQSASGLSGALSVRSAEQDRIAERLNRSDDGLLGWNSRIPSKLTQIKAGLMQDLLTGRVRVEATDAFGSG